MLDSNSTNDRSFRYNDKLAEACDSDVINADNVPNGQLQGIAIDNDLNIYTLSLIHISRKNKEYRADIFGM